ncbi:CST complex subunit STN1-like isoform X2 [Mya arenaria]|nr:CST complex subunit STN1-like isoform X2 [Mya arenaria]XP_052774309.1 CST complex subunit STN1-like isoform X2 [Mya arenaria]XP_052774310.1 CST complex subunit STN1-like isoform X2 [Mya arenaria]XP_052774311.1 CST complex subunit STN1-like isoform X2 [Mya arenaria]
MACPDPCGVHGELQFYPPRAWGLDFHFSSYKKMYIRDIQDLKPYPHFTGAFAYKNHPVYKVDIIGTIVKRVEQAKCFVYAVDDGTGVILCCIWKQPFDNYKTHIQRGSLPGPLQEKLAALEAQESSQEHGYQFGDLVHAKGKLKIFREKMEVVAIYHSRIEDPNIHVFRIHELPRVYSQCYDKPFQLPQKVRQALSLGSTTAGDQSEYSVAQDLKAILNAVVSSTDQCLYTLDDLWVFTKVKDFLTVHCQVAEHADHARKVLLVRALSLMEGEGHVVARGDRRNMYEFLMGTSKLEQTVKKTLVTETAKTKYSEKGCHYLHILDELHATLPYSKLKKEALMYCLNQLEAQSDVIRTTHAHYLPCS